MRSERPAGTTLPAVEDGAGLQRGAGAEGKRPEGGGRGAFPACGYGREVPLDPGDKLSLFQLPPERFANTNTKSNHPSQASAPSVCLQPPSRAPPPCLPHAAPGPAQTPGPLKSGHWPQEGPFNSVFPAGPLVTIGLRLLPTLTHPASPPLKFPPSSCLTPDPGLHLPEIPVASMERLELHEEHF